MALTILDRPKGRIVYGSEITAPYTNGSSTIVKVAHNISTGDYIYISDSQALGFWYVTSVTVDSFNIRRFSGDTVYTFVGAGNFTYQLTGDAHGYSAVHLPITYRISNDLYPVNSVDTARTITSLTNYSGFAQVGLSGSLGTFEDLSFVKISNAPDSDLDGVYQIVDKISTTSVILNISNTTVTNATLLGATIQLYYCSYNVVVKVFAGINATHEWAAQKPYELAATLELIPDENNEVFFSINEILKPYVKTENNLLLGTLPNNIDAWTNFYISIAESYDTSNGYSITTNESSFTSDQSTFEGTAINAELEFKNVYSGFMSDYLMLSSSGKFLTLFEEPVLFSGIYQDISFIKPTADDYTLTKQFYLYGAAGVSETETISGDAGVYRIQLEANCDYDRVDISLTMNQTIEPATGEAIFTGYEPEVYTGPPT